MHGRASFASAAVAALLVLMSLGAVGIVATQEQALFVAAGPASAVTGPVLTAADTLALPGPMAGTATPAPATTGPLPPSATPVIIYVPSSTPIPSATVRRLPAATSVPRARPPRAVCIKPYRWVNYIVQRGDTLSNLAVRLGISVTRLRQANCLLTYQIYAGTMLWVPYYLSPPYVPRPHPTLTPKPPYGGGLAVPPQLSGESPLSAVGPKVRALSVFAAILLLCLLALVRFGTTTGRPQVPSHGLNPYPTPNRQHEPGS